MLEGVKGVKWSALRHAYGPATDLPKLLRDVASADADTREGAVDKLFGNVLHQGTVWSATPHVVPFLVELAESRGVAGRDWMLLLLAGIAEAHAIAQQRNRPDNPLLVRFPKQRRNVVEACTWGAESYQAVAAGLPRILRLLDDPEPDVVFTAALVACRFRDRAADLAPLLEAAASSERGAKRRGGLLAIVGKLGYPGSVAFLEKQAASRQAAIRLGALTALVLVLGHAAPRVAVEQVRALEDDERLLEKHLRGLPWDLYAELDPHELLERLGP